MHVLQRKNAVQEVQYRVHRRFTSALEDPQLADDLEMLLFNWTRRTCERDNIVPHWDNPKFRYRYTTRALSLEFNLRHPQNQGLGNRVRAREVSLRKFAEMTPHEMYPKLWAEVYDRLAAKELRKMAISHEDAPDGVYTCRKCKSKKTQYTCLQTRSADEPMTIYVSCLECGNRWKS
jgi:DNA-directed RNA polymerase subunit M/transcription elongation factor TFIIS